MTDELMSVPEIAAMTSKPVDTIRWYRHRQTAGYDEGPRMFKLGRSVVAKRADVLAWIESQYTAEPSRVGPQASAGAKDLPRFLLARIAEDEAAAERGRRHNAHETFANDNYGCLLIDPARVLAECEAKRRIVEYAQRAALEPTSHEIVGYCAAATDAIRSLASVYADNPDYRQEWTR